MAKKGENKNPSFWDINRISVEGRIQNIPKNPPSLFLRKDVPQDLPHLLQKIRVPPYSQHNAHVLINIIKSIQSIKVTRGKWAGRTPKK